MNIDNQNIPDNNKNPWKGLNFYTEEDKDNFFGRDEEIQRLSLYVINNTQSVLYGKSGIGKSSIIQAGIFPIARAEGMLPISIRLSHDNEQTYIEQIREKFTEEENLGRLEIREIVPRINNHEESLWEYFHRHQFFVPGTETIIRPLIVFDQFEEIFTLQKNEKLKLAFFAELADLLNEVKPQYIVDAQNKATNQYEDTSKSTKKSFELDFGTTDNREQQKEYAEASNFNIIFVIREDFLAHLERYTRFIPSMKTNRFALLPLNEEQAAEIIMKPQAGLLSAEVAELIIQKVTQRQDFRIGDEPEVEVDAVVLSLYLSQLYTKRDGDGVITKEMVNDYGSTIIRNFYEGAVSDLPQNEIEILEDLLLTYDGRRNNVSVRDIMRKGVSKHVIDILTEDRKLLRLFNYQNDDRIEYMHDVLCQVVSDRVNQRELHRAQQGEKLQKRKNRVLRWGIAASVLILVAVGLYVWDGYFRIIEKYYGIVVKENGWYVGLEPLDQEEIRHRAYYYVLRFEGSRGKGSKLPLEMEARNGYGELTDNHNIEPFILEQFKRGDQGVDENLYEQLETACRWEFITNQERDFLVQIRARNEQGEVVYLFNRSQTRQSNKVICTYTDEYGFPLFLKDGREFYLCAPYDENGRESLVEFFDEYGVPTPNKNGIYQISKSYLGNGIESAIFYHFWTGQLKKNRAEFGMKHTRFTQDSLRVLETLYLDDELQPTKSYWDEVPIIKYTYDEHGNCIEESYWDEKDKPAVSYFGYHRVVKTYTSHGELESLMYYSTDSSATYKTEYIGDSYCKLLEKHLEYDNQGHEIVRKLICDTFLFYNNHCYAEDGTVMMQEMYYIYNSSPRDTVYSFRYYYDPIKRSRLTIDYKENYAKRTSSDERGNVTYVQYFASDNKERIKMNGFHVNYMEYKYNGDTTYITDKCYNEQNVLTYHHEIIVDSINHTKNELTFDPVSGEFKEGVRETYDDEFKVIKSRESINRKKETYRTYENPEFYYRIHFVYPIKPSIKKEEWGRYAVSELNDASLVYEKAENRAYYARSIDNTSNDFIYYNEWGNIIESNEYDWKYLAYIEVKDGISIGFQNADIILACNGWNMSFLRDPDMAFNNTEWENEVDRDFIVARCNSNTNEYDTVHIHISAALTNITDFVQFKKCRCTHQEEERIWKMLKKYILRDVISAASIDDNSILRQMGINGEIIILEWNKWKYKEQEVTAFEDIVESTKLLPKHIVFWDVDADSIGVIQSEQETLGLTFETSTYRLRYQRLVDESYENWKIRTGE